MTTKAARANTSEEKDPTANSQEALIFRALTEKKYQAPTKTGF